MTAPDISIAGNPASEDFGFIELINAASALTGSGNAALRLELYEIWLRHHPADPLRYAACFNHGVLLAGEGHTAHAATAYAEAARIAPAFLPASRWNVWVTRARQSSNGGMWPSSWRSSTAIASA